MLKKATEVLKGSVELEQEIQQNQKKGFIAGLTAYVLWGVLPFYWKSLGEVSALSILCYRIFWSFLFMMAVLFITGKFKSFIIETRELIHDRKRAFAIILAAILVSINWFIFIFSVGSGQVIEASLGYYINPLVNVVLATIFLKERLGRPEVVACLFAALGVIALTVQNGVVPWSSLAIALSFSLYGLIKKVAKVTSLTGLTLETLVMLPFATIFLLFFSPEGFMHFSVTTNALIIGSGIATAIPLFLFAEAAKNISYILLGFIQYITPILMLIAAVFVFHEKFALPQLLAFSCIWLGIIIFATSNVLLLKRNSMKN